MTNDLTIDRINRLTNELDYGKTMVIMVSSSHTTIQTSSKLITNPTPKNSSVIMANSTSLVGRTRISVEFNGDCASSLTR